MVSRFTCAAGNAIVGMSARDARPVTRLRGRQLLLARVAWVVVAVTALAKIAFSVPSSLEYYRGVCTAAAGVCSERAGDQATPEGVRALRDAGPPVRFYALLRVAIDKVFELVWFAVGALIYWRRSEDPVALLVSVFLVAFGTGTFDITAADTLISSHPVWWLPVRSVQTLGEVGIVLFFFLFPDGRFTPSWTRWLAVAFIAFLVSRAGAASPRLFVAAARDGPRNESGIAGRDAYRSGGRDSATS